MRIAIAAALAALAFTSTVALAQQAETPAIPASRCPGVPATPQFPDGATARNAAAMERGNTAYETWSRGLQEVLQCRQTEARELRNAAEAARLHAEARVQEFNAAVRGQCDVVRAWRAEVSEFNTRHGQETPAPPAGDPCAGPATN